MFNLEAISEARTQLLESRSFSFLCRNAFERADTQSLNLLLQQLPYVQNPDGEYLVPHPDRPLSAINSQTFRRFTNHFINLIFDNIKNERFTEVIIAISANLHVKPELYYALTSSKESLLYLAAFFGNTRLIESLIQEGYYEHAVKIADRDTLLTPLYGALNTQKFQAFKLLFEADRKLTQEQRRDFYRNEYFNDLLIVSSLFTNDGEREDIKQTLVSTGEVNLRYRKDTNNPRLFGKNYDEMVLQPWDLPLNRISKTNSAITISPLSDRMINLCLKLILGISVTDHEPEKSGIREKDLLMLCNVLDKMPPKDWFFNPATLIRPEEPDQQPMRPGLQAVGNKRSNQRYENFVQKTINQLSRLLQEAQKDKDRDDDSILQRTSAKVKQDLSFLLPIIINHHQDEETKIRLLTKLFDIINPCADVLINTKACLIHLIYIYHATHNNKSEQQKYFALLEECLTKGKVEYCNTHILTCYKELMLVHHDNMNYKKFLKCLGQYLANTPNTGEYFNEKLDILISFQCYSLASSELKYCKDKITKLLYNQLIKILKWQTKNETTKVDDAFIEKIIKIGDKDSELTSMQNKLKAIVLSEAYLLREDSEQALQILVDAIKHPSTALANNDRLLDKISTIIYKEVQCKGALKYLRQLEEALPESYTLHHTKIICLIAEGFYTAAAAEWEIAKQKIQFINNKCYNLFKHCMYVMLITHLHANPSMYDLQQVKEKFFADPTEENDIIFANIIEEFLSEYNASQTYSLQEKRGFEHLDNPLTPEELQAQWMLLSRLAPGTSDNSTAWDDPKFGQYVCNNQEVIEFEPGKYAAISHFAKFSDPILEKKMHTALTMGKATRCTGQQGIKVLNSDNGIYYLELKIKGYSGDVRMIAPDILINPEGKFLYLFSRFATHETLPDTLAPIVHHTTPLSSLANFIAGVEDGPSAEIPGTEPLVHPLPLDQMLGMLEHTLLGILGGNTPQSES